VLDLISRFSGVKILTIPKGNHIGVNKGRGLYARKRMTERQVQERRTCGAETCSNRPPSWDLHLLCFKHRECSVDKTCEICLSLDKDAWAKVCKAKGESASKRKAHKRTADVSAPKTARQEGGTFNWSQMKDYFDDSMRQYVSQTVTSTIESSVNPLATQMSDMTQKFSSFYTRAPNFWQTSRVSHHRDQPQSTHRPTVLMTTSLMWPRRVTYL
jgi:hypothetical protein